MVQATIKYLQENNKININKPYKYTVYLYLFYIQQHMFLTGKRPKSAQ